MRRPRVCSLDFENLEGRMLLTKAPHHAAIHAAIVHHPVKVAPAKVPVVLDGTLMVNNKAATNGQDAMGDTTTTIPVSGTLNGIGQVAGFWNESTDSFGDYLGPDSVQLQTPQGKISIAFNDGLHGRLQKSPQGTYTYQVKQKFAGGTGSYAHATESGTIEITINKAKTAVLSMTLNTTGS